MNIFKLKKPLNTTFNHNYYFFKGLMVLFLLTASISSNLFAADKIYHDAVALNGLKHAKGVVWLSLNAANKTAKYLEVFAGTHERAQQQGVELDMVLMFNGPMVAFLTSQPKDELALEYGEYLKSISDSVAKLKKLGVRMEVCGIATDVVGVDPKTLLPGLTNISDGAISLIGWQYQGYKLIPLF